MTKRCCSIARGFGDLRFIRILYPRLIVQQGGVANPACLNPNVSCGSIAPYWLFAGHIRSAYQRTSSDRLAMSEKVPKAPF
jgi:hypothetical protein